MAYIPKDDDEQQQSGMNILAPQNQQQNQQPDEQNQPQNISGGQSATIASGQAQQGSQGQSQAPKGQKKKAKSGMFTNIRKYIDQNKAGAQRMSGKLQENVSQQNQNIQQAIQKQQTDFMSRVNRNRERMQNAQQFGQQTIESAKSQESMPMLQQQQQDIQQRIGQFGNVSDQTQNIGQTQQQITDQQAAYNQAQQAYNQAQQSFESTVGSLVPNLGQVQSGQTYIRGIGGDNRFENNYYTNEQLQQGLISGNQDFINAVQQNLSQDQQLVDQIESSPYGFFGKSPSDIERYEQAKQRLDSFQNYRNQLSARNQAQQSQSGALSQLESYQDQLGRAKEQQRLFQNKTQLQGELSELEQRIENAPESLTEDDITRFNQLRTGIERFDDAILNLSEQRRGVQDLVAQAESLGTSQGRRNLMRQEFGRQGGYTSGQAALDNLILTGDPQAMRDLVQNSQAQAEQAQQNLEQAFREGRVTQDEMARGTRQIQRDLQSGVEQAQTALLQGLEERARTGEGTFIRELQDKVASGQGLSQQDLATLGLTGQESFANNPEQLLRNIQINPEQFGIQDVANLTDVARADALARLSGEQAGENKFLTQQLGIDNLERQAIEARNLRSPEEEFTRTRNELAPADRAVVDQFVQDLGNAKYENPQQAREDVKNTTYTKHGVSFMNDAMQTLAEGRPIQIYGRTITPEDIENEDQQALGIIRDANAWSGYGRTGWTGHWVNPHSIVNAYKEGKAKMSALESVYTSGQNRLLSESDTAYNEIDQARSFINK